MMPRIDLSKRRFGNLIVIGRAPDADDGRTRWLCRCDCGTPKIVRTANLTTGTVTGCSICRRPVLRPEHVKERRRAASRRYHARYREELRQIRRECGR